MTDKYRLMGAEKAYYPVKMTAPVPEVSGPGFHGWPAKGGADDPWAGVREAVRRVWLEPGRRFGARAAHAFLSGEAAGATPCRVGNA